MTKPTDKKLLVYYYVYWHDKRFKKQVGGPTKVWELGDNLKKRGHEVFLFVPRIGFPERQTRARVISIALLDLPVFRMLSYHLGCMWHTMATILRFGKPQVIYVRIMWSFLPMMFGRILSVPVILEVNDSPQRAYGRMKSRWKRWLVSAINRVSYCLSDCILAVTTRVADEMHTCEHVPRKKLRVMESGANTMLFRPMDRDLCCTRLGLSSQLFYVGFIGTCFEHQGVGGLIDCAPEVIDKFAQVRFLIVGDGPMKTQWQRRVEQKGLRTKFIFTGHVDYQSVPLYCNVMDVCVAPFLGMAKESSGVKVFEYLSCGKPVVLSDIQNSGEQFSSSNAVVLVPAENSVELSRAICSLILDSDKRKTMGQNGRDYITRQYDRFALSGRVEKIAEKLISRRLSSEGPHG